MRKVINTATSDLASSSDYGRHSLVQDGCLQGIFVRKLLCLINIFHCFSLSIILGMFYLLDGWPVWIWVHMGLWSWSFSKPSHQAQFPLTKEHQLLKAFHSVCKNHRMLLVISVTLCAFAVFKGTIGLFAAFFDEGFCVSEFTHLYWWLI